MAVMAPTRNLSAAGTSRCMAAGTLNTYAPLSSASVAMLPSSSSASHSVQVPAGDLYCSRPTSVKARPCQCPLACSCNGLWSSNSSAILPTRLSTSPSRTTVLRQ